MTPKPRPNLAYLALLIDEHGKDGARECVDQCSAPHKQAPCGERACGCWAWDVKLTQGKLGLLGVKPVRRVRLSDVNAAKARLAGETSDGV